MAITQEAAIIPPKDPTTMKNPVALASFGTAESFWNGNELIVRTGKIERKWKWTGFGLTTVSLRNQVTGYEWVTTPSVEKADWRWHFQNEENLKKIEILNVSACVSDDEGFTSRHVNTVVHVRYSYLSLEFKFSIWAYPGASGLRTQLSAILMSHAYRGSTDVSEGLHPGTECLPIGFNGRARHAFGYYNETQKRNGTEFDMIREERVENVLNTPEITDWASAMCVEGEGEGVALVKESYKTVLQKGHDTGAFICDPNRGLLSSGWGLIPSEVRIDRERKAWAHWTLLYEAGQNQREIAFKTFDRIRYPLDPERDVYIIANTWGSGNAGENGSGSRADAREDVVLREIESAADLGIDVQQIDDGWQVPCAQGLPNKWKPEKRWEPHPEMYPQGWKTVVEAGKRQGVKLGLWAAGLWIKLDELKENYDKGGFQQYKLDFLNLHSHDLIEEVMTKVRQFILYTGHKVRVNWDLTELPPRVGYFYGREYGCVYLANRKCYTPTSVVYIPHTMLKDAWQLCRYVNLTKFQITIQNPARVNPEASDAIKHSADYCVAIALMGTPVFFQLTQLYSKEAREQIRPLLTAYRKVRHEMYENMVFAIGNRPDNTSWTGFQNCKPEGKAGYVTVFREIQNAESSTRMKLRFLEPGARIKFTNLLSGECRETALDASSAAEFKIEKPADYRFLKYEVV
jgi:hypothetical protein